MNASLPSPTSSGVHRHHLAGERAGLDRRERERVDGHARASTCAVLIGFADEFSRQTAITRSKFDNNIAESTESGGTLFSSGAFKITNSEFTNNKGGSGGGSIRRAF